MPAVLPKSVHNALPSSPTLLTQKELTEEERETLYTTVNKEPQNLQSTTYVQLDFADVPKSNKIHGEKSNTPHAEIDPDATQAMKRMTEEEMKKVKREGNKLNNPAEILPIIGICRKTKCTSKFNIRRPTGWNEGQEEVVGTHVWTIEGVKEENPGKKERYRVFKIATGYKVEKSPVEGETKERLMDNFEKMYGDIYQDCLQRLCPRIDDDVAVGKKRRTMKKNKNKKTVKKNKNKKKATMKKDLRKRRKSNKKK